MRTFAQYLQEFDDLYNLGPDQDVDESYSPIGRYHDFNGMCFDNKLPAILVFFDHNLDNFKLKYKDDDNFTAGAFAHCWPEDKPSQWSIHIRGDSKVYTRDSLDATLLHEMIHVHMALIGERQDSYEHGTKFRHLCNTLQHKAGIKSSVLNADLIHLQNLKSQIAKPMDVYVELIITQDNQYIARFHPETESLLNWAKYFAEFESNPNAPRKPSHLPYEDWKYVGGTAYFMKVKVPVPQHAFQRTFHLTPEDGKRLFKSGHFKYEVKDGEVFNTTLKKVADMRSKKNFSALLFHTEDNKWYVIYSDSSAIEPNELFHLRFRMKVFTQGPFRPGDLVTIHGKPDDFSQINDSDKLGQATVYALDCSSGFFTLSKETKLYKDFRGPINMKIQSHEANRLLSFGKHVLTVSKGIEVAKP